jgi:hypothetical protein
MLGTLRVFQRKSTFEDVIGSHACSLEAIVRATNDIPLGRPLTVVTINLKICPNMKAMRLSRTLFFDEKV